ncbi:TrmH family RNA methyltransferase [Colibacter massiliensis]|uniref:TrmH family RNA methyltransferase n=1 Tax=Colibacter massiliensis TaxID=1852379 RepID=UPI003F92CEAE
MQDITSRDNRLIRLALSLKQKKHRYEEHKLLAEGMRLVGDALANGIRGGICLVTEKTAAGPDFAALYEKGRALGWKFFRTSAGAYDKIKETQATQGITAVLPFFEYTLQDLIDIEPYKAVLYLECIQDPGNLGTIIRTAAATGAGAVLLSENSVDLYNDKTVRSAMGAIFKVPVVQGVMRNDLQDYCKKTGRRLLMTAADAKTVYTDIDWHRPSVVVFGNEGAGLSAEMMEQGEEFLAVPMRDDTESLNLAVTVGVVLYKAWEQAGFKEQ